MVAKASVFQRTQIGLETTPGTAVNGSKRLPNLMLAANPEYDSKTYRGQGDKFTSSAVVNKSWSTFKYDSVATYDELAYIFASIFSKQTPVDATGVETWTFAVNSSAADVPATYTIEHGDAARAGRLAHGLFTDMTLHFTRDECKVSGNGIGQLWGVNHALTASPTIIPSAPIVANQVSITIDALFANIGTTPLTSAYEVELGITGRWGPNWVLDAAYTSFKDYVELVPKVTLKLTLQNDATSDAFITQINSGATNYMEILAVGNNIPTTSTPYSLDIQIPFQVLKGGSVKDLAGVYVAEWELEIIDDPTAGYAIHPILVNGLTAL